MIKIEYVEGVGTITREGEECGLFVGMQISEEEVLTITASGDVTYCIDEQLVVVVPKGEKATINKVTPVEATEEVTETETEEKVEEPTETVETTEVVTETVETAAKATAKK